MANPSCKCAECLLGYAWNCVVASSAREESANRYSTKDNSTTASKGVSWSQQDTAADIASNDLLPRLMALRIGGQAQPLSPEKQLKKKKSVRFTPLQPTKDYRPSPTGGTRQHNSAIVHQGLTQVSSIPATSTLNTSDRHLMGNLWRQLERTQSTTSFPSPSSAHKVIFHFVRHAQAIHNVRPKEFNTLNDPPLTKEGFEQCVTSSKFIPYMDRITHVLTSPMTRAIQTSFLLFNPSLRQRGLKAILWPDLKEHGNGAPSRGTRLDLLRLKMKDMPINWKLMDHGWEQKFTTTKTEKADREAFVKGELYALAQAASRGGLWNGIKFEAHKGNVEILIVSHGGFLKGLLNLDRQLYNTEHKSYEFASAEEISSGAHKLDLIERLSGRK